MRTWRRIADDPRYQKTHFTDIEIKRKLNIPSLDCFVRKRRLIYWSRLSRANFDALHAMLQAKTKHGKPLPWVAMLITDLEVLQNALPIKLDELGNPEVDLHHFWQLAHDFPLEWRKIVDMYFTHAEDMTTQVQKNRSAGFAFQ